MDHYRHLETKVQTVEPVTAEQTARIWAEVGITKSSLASDVALIRDWLHKQPHLPADDVDDTAIERLLVRCKNSVRAVQRRLDEIYSVRSDMPEFYTDRDPLDPEIQKLHRVIGMCVVPRLTPDLRRVAIIRLRDPDIGKFNVEAFVKVAFMGQELVVRETPTLGDILIFDARGYTLAHAVAAQPTLIRRALVHITRTYPARISGVHVLFPPVFADRILSVIKSFLPEKLSSRIHTHSSLDTLTALIPKEILPRDYGGKEKSSDELCDLWEEKLMSYRDYFLQTEKVKSDEARRPVKLRDNNVSSVEGSFRKLEID